MEKEIKIIEELRKNWHEWDFDEKMLFILSKIKEAEDRKVEEIKNLKTWIEMNNPSNSEVLDFIEERFNLIKK
jgi:hypothetical protein